MVLGLGIIPTIFADKIIDVETSQSSEIYESRVRRTAEESDVVAYFWTFVPPLFAGPKESCDPRDHLSELKTADDWNTHDSVRGLFAR